MTNDPEGAPHQSAGFGVEPMTNMPRSRIPSAAANPFGSNQQRSQEMSPRSAVSFAGLVREAIAKAGRYA